MMYLDWPSAVNAVKWDAANKDSSITLSNNDTTCAASAAFTMVKALVSAKSSGKWYFEVTFDTAATFCILGLAPNNTSNGYAPGFSIDTFGAGTGFTYNNSSSSSIAVGAIDSGETCAFAVDLDNGYIWWLIEGGPIWVGQSGVDTGFGIGVGDPATGSNPRYSFTPSGSYLPGCSPNTGVVTINQTLKYSPPSGFTAWT